MIDALGGARFKGADEDAPRESAVAAIEAASEKVRAERQGTETPPDAWADAVTRSAWALVSRIFPRGEQP